MSSFRSQSLARDDGDIYLVVTMKILYCRVFIRVALTLTGAALIPVMVGCGEMGHDAQVDELAEALNQEKYKEAERILDSHPNLANALIMPDHPNVQFHSYRPLHYASSMPPRLVKKLIKYGADLNAKTANGGTPLHSAIVGKYPENVELLLKHGADPNAKNGDGIVPIVALAESETVHGVEMLEIMARYGVDFNAVGRNGESLIQVIWAGPSDAVVDMAEFLVQRGWKPELRIAIELAMVRHRTQELRRVFREEDLQQIAQPAGLYNALTVMLQGMTAGMSNEEADRVVEENLDLYDLLMQRGVTAERYPGFGAMFVAVQLKSTRVARWLVDHGAPVKHPNGELTISPMDVARISGQGDLVRFLRDKGVQSGLDQVGVAVSAVKVLIQGLEDERSAVRAAAVRALGLYAPWDQDAERAVRQAQNDPHPDVQSAAAEVIKRLVAPRRISDAHHP